MRVLVQCERSGVVRRAFRELGHDAWSCDIEPADDGSEFHLQCDARDVPMGYGNHWDLWICHPPCTYLTNAGARWWPGKQREQAEALDFVRWLMNAPVEKIAVENPPGKIGTAIRKADQYIQPHQFGHPETKTTGLWLKNLQPLKPTKDVSEQMRSLPAKERHRVHWMSPSKDRARLRSQTYAGIAQAMAEQWGA